MSKRSRVELEQDMARANEAKGLLASEVFETALSFVESNAQHREHGQQLTTLRLHHGRTSRCQST